MSEHDTAQEATPKRGPRTRKTQPNNTNTAHGDIDVTINDMTGHTAEDPHQAIWRAGYEAGYAQGVADSQPKVPLFEACKAIAEQDAPTSAIRRDIQLLQEERGEHLSTADIDLLMATASRNQIAREARAQAELERHPNNAAPRRVTVGRREIVDTQPDIHLT